MSCIYQGEPLKKTEGDIHKFELIVYKCNKPPFYYDGKLISLDRCRYDGNAEECPYYNL